MSLNNRTHTVSSKHLSQFISLLSTLVPHTARSIRSTFCPRMQHEKIQVKFLCFQHKHKAATSRWDQFRTSVSVLARLHCVKDRCGGKHGGGGEVLFFSLGFNSFFVVPLSRSASGVFSNLPVPVPRSGSAMGRQCRSCPGKHEDEFTCHANPKKEKKRMKLAIIKTRAGSCLCWRQNNLTKHSSKS